MAVQMNMNNFKKYLNKASVSYLINSLSIKFSGSEVSSNLISSDGQVISLIKKQNDFINLVAGNEQMELYFNDIAGTLQPYLKLIKDENVYADIGENKMSIKDSDKKRFNFFFCSREFTSEFGGKDPSDRLTYFYDSDFSEIMFNKISDIKEVARKFGKAYITAKDGVLYMETTDKTNKFCNGVNIELDKVEDKELDISLCFDFKNLWAIMETIKDQSDFFRFRITYVPEQDLGMILFQGDDNSEKFFVTSKKEF